ncbi:hypothetical protein [Rhodoferax saidenbachensis]|uniref:DUF3108 domain-containing protein n=1 Tax=Rhodoferax saidenbachensis TaxID=1484693 RepID=A0ABU1ZS30_9BURK|nr:hypothetical protein [Rhodoferax saidenbachensis]MDR7308360.1 hypothetical protein [Rhodoferax saidenbachensis]
MTVLRRATLGLAMAVLLPVAHAQAPKPAQPMHHQNIHDAAVAEVLRFYAPFGNPLDTARWRVSIEDFEWQDAVYRIDVAVDEYPTLVPWKSAYVMAHRIWMTATGRVVQTEPIYDRPNLANGGRSDAVPASRRGFYPGNAQFAAQLDFLHTALKLAGTIEAPMDRPLPGTVLRFRFPLGTQDLASGRAEVVETETHYQIHMLPPQDATNTALGHGYQLHFRVHKGTGQVADPQLILVMPPALM